MNTAWGGGQQSGGAAGSGCPARLGVGQVLVAPPLPCACHAALHLQAGTAQLEGNPRAARRDRLHRLRTVVASTLQQSNTIAAG